MIRVQQGFTLVEVMVTAAVIGILASLAMPAYMDYMIRGRVSEGAGIVFPAKLQVAQARTVAGLTTIANSWNGQAGGAGAASKYVAAVQMDTATGELTVTFNGANVGGAAAPTIIYTPYVLAAGVPKQLKAALAAGDRGMFLWGCASESNIMGASKNTPVVGPAVGGGATLEAKHAPKECR